MRQIKIGMVAEGPTDCVVIKELFGAYFNSKEILDCELSFKNIQPYVDNTSNSGYSEGGWQLVYKWCLANPPEDRINTFFGSSLFADDMDDFQCSMLLIHMDADICDQIGEKTNVTPIPKIEEDPVVRGKFITATIESWLWPIGLVKDERYIIAPAVESTEAWLVAGLSEEDISPESNHSIQQRLAELDYSVVRMRPIPPKIKGPDKRAKNFERISRVAARNIPRIVDRCHHFKVTAELIMQAIDAQKINI